ncbi:2-dehydro-3-deoxy-6-phosphogalactonate aldolase [Kiloniella sp. EL199]|uniref:2-dehydro-3-deoxy-6-phosphogalactonate aldolase n=1 Tax=Kiloniella sp. EL199 TaxID=2107581 RepID=UPI000EA3BB9F|nr:2-dehydro-3-deoxy-6-phosphogalactonate aldolase [Kiloniella sp. EL199]
MTIEHYMSYLEKMPLIAILRGIHPEQAIAVSDHIVEAGFTCMEVTLNTKGWQASIQAIHKRHGNNILLGAGTVLSPKDVTTIKDIGGRIIISPNMDPAVIQRTKELGLLSAPGCYTPTECFTALSHGADILKLFPAETLGLPFIKATKSVLPPNTHICPTGGVTPDNMKTFLEAGVFALGIGSAIFKPGKTLTDIRSSADKFAKKFIEFSDQNKI